MNIIKHMLTLTALYSTSVYAMDSEWHRIIDENQNESEVLEEILLRMPAFIKPKYDITAAKRILDMGISPNDAVDRGNTLLGNPGSSALTSAAARGCTEYVKLLLDYGANIETKSPWNGFTALMYASMNGHNELVTVLIDRGANVHASVQFDPDDEMRTSLILAAKDGRAETLPLLFKAGACMRIAHPKGKTLIQRIQESSDRNEQNHKNVVQLLKTRIIDQAESTVIFARTYKLPSDVWAKIISYLDLEDIHINKLIEYLGDKVQ